MQCSVFSWAWHQKCPVGPRHRPWDGTAVRHLCHVSRDHALGLCVCCVQLYKICVLQVYVHTHVYNCVRIVYADVCVCVVCEGGCVLQVYICVYICVRIVYADVCVCGV